MQKIMFNDRYGLTESVLSGRKTMTRRIIGHKLLEKIDRFQDEYYNLTFDLLKGVDLIMAYFLNFPEKYPYKIGDVVAVAQSYKDAGIGPDYIVLHKKDGTPVTAIQSPGWGNKMFTRAELMPHQIRTTGVRVERLQDISDEDCLREGIEPMLVGCEYYMFSIIDTAKGRWYDYKTPREAFAALIDKVSGRGTWESNPYVVVDEFGLIK